MHDAEEDVREAAAENRVRHGKRRRARRVRGVGGVRIEDSERRKGLGN